MIPAICLSRKASFVRSVRESGLFDVIAWASDRKVTGADVVSRSNELSIYLKGYAGDAVVLVFGFGIIIGKEDVLSRKIFNFHPGDLSCNRGPTPVVWSILLGNKDTRMTLHRMQQEVDTGWVIGEIIVPVLTEDTVLTLSNRLETTVPELLSQLLHYLEGKTPAIREARGGIYRGRVKPSDYTLDPANDSLEEMNRKIQSQAAWNGAILPVEGQFFRIFGMDILPCSFVGEPGKPESWDSNAVTLTAGNHQLVFFRKPQMNSGV